MYKKIVVLFLLLSMSLSLAGCSFNFSEWYFANIHANVPEEEWTEKIPAHRVDGGKTKQAEIDAKAKEALNTYFEEKYGAWIKINKMHILVDFDVETEGSILPLEIKHTPVFSGLVIAECEYKDQTFIAYVDTNQDEMRCYDNYQKEEIKQAVKDYFQSLDDTNPVILDVETKSRNGINLHYGFDNVFDLTYMMHERYDGDMAAFLDTDGFEGSLVVECCYVTENGLETRSEALEQFSGNNVKIYCFKNQDGLSKYDNSNLGIDYFWPYVSGYGMSDEVFYNSNHRHETPTLYIEPTLLEAGDLYWYSPYLSKNFIERDVSEHNIYAEDHLYNWVPEIKESVVEETDEQTINRVEVYNVAKMVTPIYTYPSEDITVFYPINKIEGYSSSKVYKLCCYSWYDNAGKIEVSYKTEDLTIIGDYIVLKGYDARHFWFIVEVTNPIIN